MPGRFSILKSDRFDGLYAILDTEEHSIVAMADTYKEAQQVVRDIGLLLHQDKIVSEAMDKFFNETT